MHELIKENSTMANKHELNFESFLHNLSAEELTRATVKIGEGSISDLGALSIKTGKFTGRSPKDRFIVDSPKADKVDWNNINQKFPEDRYHALKSKLVAYLNSKQCYVQDSIAGADKRYSINVKVVAEKPWSAQFAYNMFLRPTKEELSNFKADWHVLCAPEFKANPEVDGTRSENFAIINFDDQVILIGGTGYTGEIKKGIFSVLNYLLPTNYDVLPMHCSANIGAQADTAIFFGLSGTGKTTLSNDPERELIGDDEHALTDDNVFNFEGGCYAKCIDLNEKSEPQIYNAIKEGAILENILYKEGSKMPDFEDSTITENTRVSYPIYHIDNYKEDSKGSIPKNIFFLTCDAFGVLPPVSKLDQHQAAYHFISGYTAKVAGTEAGVTEPLPSFSACFGAPFMPLHPTRYAEMLSEKMKETGVNVWLVNTGWFAGPYGVGDRMKLKYTRAMIDAALNGGLPSEITYEDYHIHSVFGLAQPRKCPGIPSELLSQRQAWNNDEGYYKTAHKLADSFRENFKQFEEFANEEILAGGPPIIEK